MDLELGYKQQASSRKRQAASGKPTPGRGWEKSFLQKRP